MRIGFFGTPQIAAYCLGELVGTHDVAFIVSNDDKPCGRHLKVRCCPAKEVALEHGIRFYHPGSLKEKPFIEALRLEGSDLFVVVAFGRIIPREVFEIPRLGTINLHPSLLPRYRGAAPVEWALINGDTETGVTVQMINERLDAGDIVVQEELPIPAGFTAADLYDAVRPLGAGLLLKAIDLLGAGTARPRPQDDAKATYCGKIDHELAHVDWKAGATKIHNLVRGLNPRPGAWTSFRGAHIKIWKTAQIADGGPLEPAAPGRVLVHEKKRLLVGTEDGWIEILSLQPETKRVMDGLSFINGYRPAANDRFE
ncbi:MAG TPA: methionyl-tRNA formyltransferase [Spirochaetota bacterium]|nr:methionyl-tRNA formyltransferase [Spirochaetota bacterium]